jgi:hypothetical protein
MTTEPFGYRARKWVVQQISRYRSHADQHKRLNDVNWDILVILDACRFDVFQSIANWPVDACRSPGSTTGQWLSVAENTRVFEDTHIVSGNGQYVQYDVGAAELHRIWETHWNAELGTVLPEPVLETADDLLQEDVGPTVAHVLPPHAPYVAKVGDEWLSLLPDVDIWKLQPGLENEDKLSPQVAMADGRVNMDRCARGYRCSVRSVWETCAQYIGRWVSEGHTVVVTADHGETFGRGREYGLYEHPRGCHVAPLVRVPFIKFSQSNETDRTPDSVKEHLEALGYVS